MPTPAEIEAAYAPRIAAAHSAAQTVRDGAFVEVAFEVCGLLLRPLTLRDYLHLVLAGNAHVTPQPVPESAEEQLRFWAVHNAQLLWAQSAGCVLGDTRARDRFVAEKIAPLDFMAVATGIGEYLAESFFDAPRGGGARTEAAYNDPLRVSFVAHHVHRFAHAYGWPLAETLALPLKVTFQLARLIRAEEQMARGHAPSPHFDESDRLWAEMLGALNGKSSPVSPSA